ncbi:bactofilin family protein [Thermovibrio sp.]
MLKKRESRDDSKIRSILSEDLKVEGKVEAKGKVRIDGVIVGDVFGEFLIFGPKSKVEGNVKGKTVVLLGEVKGDVEASKLEVKSSGKVEGNIKVKELLVEGSGPISGNVICGSFLEGPKKGSRET